MTDIDGQYVYLSQCAFLKRDGNTRKVGIYKRNMRQ